MLYLQIITLSLVLMFLCQSVNITHLSNGTRFVNEPGSALDHRFGFLIL